MIYIPIKEWEYKGMTYPVNDNVLDMIELIGLLEEEQDGFERAIMIVTYVFGVDIPIDNEVVEKAVEIVSLGRKNEDGTPNKKVVDYEHDFNTIRMDILREYNKDVLDDMTWFDFRSMVENLSGKSNLSRIGQARTVDLSKIKDPETKKAWAEFKKQVALPTKEVQKFNDEKEFYKDIMDKFKKGG